MPDATRFRFAHFLAADADSAGAAKGLPHIDAAMMKTMLSDAIADKDLTAGDAELRKLLGPDAPIIPLWPTGTRSDDR